VIKDPKIIRFAGEDPTFFFFLSSFVNPVSVGVLLVVGLLH